MRQKAVTLGILALCVLLIIGAVLMALWRFGAPEAAPAPAAAAETPAGAEPAESAARERPDLLTGRTDAQLQKQPYPVDGAYFADAAFLVNSVSKGLDLYDYEELLRAADFYGEEELSCFDAMEYIRAMESGDYGKVYISLGVNELHRDIEYIQPCYENMLAQLREYDEDMIIVLVSVPPVSAYRSETDYSCNRKNVLAYNEMLRALALEWDAWYLDVYSVLGDEEGYLPSEVTMDGIHFTPAYYAGWFEALANCYVDDGTVAAEPAAQQTPEVELLPAPEGSGS